MSDEFIKNVKFSGNQSARDEMLALVDSVMKTHGEFESLGDLSTGLSNLAETKVVKVIDEDDTLAVVVTESDGGDEIGRFVIHKQTKTVYQVGADAADEVAIDEDMDFLDEI